MLAIVAAIIFGLALLIDLIDAKVSDAFTWTTLLMAGMFFLALHFAGVGSGAGWRWGRYRR